MAGAMAGRAGLLLAHTRDEVAVSRREELVDEQGTLPLTKQGFYKVITLYLWGTKGTKRQPKRSHCCQASLWPTDTQAGNVTLPC